MGTGMVLLVLTLVLAQLAAPPQFHEYVSESGGFSVSLPGVPVEAPLMAEDGSEQYRLMLAGYDGAYLVLYTDLPDLGVPRIWWTEGSMRVAVEVKADVHATDHWPGPNDV